MKKGFAAFLIAVVSFGVLGVHAWKTWDEADKVPTALQSDREFFEFSLFLESFAFMVSAAYFVGPRIYRFFGEESASVQFSGEKERVSRLVHIYSAIAVTVRRLSFDRQMGISIFETMIVVVLISVPAILPFLRRKLEPNVKRSKTGRV